MSPISRVSNSAYITVPTNGGRLRIGQGVFDKFFNPNEARTHVNDERLVLASLRLGKLPKAVFARAESEFPFAYDQAAMQAWEIIVSLSKRRDYHDKFDLASILQNFLHARVPMIPKAPNDKWMNDDFDRIRSYAFSLDLPQGDERAEAFVDFVKQISQDKPLNGEKLKTQWREKPIRIQYQFPALADDETGETDYLTGTVVISAKAFRDDPVLFAAFIDAIVYKAADLNNTGSRKALVNTLNTLSQYSFWS